MNCVIFIKIKNRGGVMKKCSVCNITKPITEFPKYSRGREHIGDGHENRCKKCLSNYRKSPERLAITKERDRKRRQSTTYKLKKKISDQKYSQTDKGKQAHKKAQAKYLKTDRGKSKASKTNKKYRRTQKYKDAINKHRNKFPERRAANIKIANALSTGKIARPNQCSICNNHCIPQGHHPDYSKPLDVVWVCHNCHTGIHWRE